ncbi:MAG: hypothetical protein ACLGIS_17975 [Actinomycetes bacterium]
MKPGKSRNWLIGGLIAQGIGGMIYAGGVVNTLTATAYSGGGGSTGMTVGGLLIAVGWVVLIIGISKASAGIDYLVSVAPSGGAARPGGPSDTARGEDARPATGDFG